MNSKLLIVLWIIGLPAALYGLNQPSDWKAFTGTLVIVGLLYITILKLKNKTT